LIKAETVKMINLFGQSGPVSGFVCWALLVSSLRSGTYNRRHPSAKAKSNDLRKNNHTTDTL
jgi:hypothetical protein